jgi:Uma2 family endonuclease
MEAVAERLYSLEEYFAFCEKQEGRFEFVNGEIIEMAGETTTSNRIAGNIHRYLGNILEDGPYMLLQNAVKLRVEEDRVFRIPDFLVCEEKGDAYRYATDPLLIVEVLSESTATTDRVDKLHEYCLMPSLKYYLIVEQAKCSVEVYIHDDDRWYVEFYNKMEDVIKLPFFDIELPLSAIYKKVVFVISTSF